MNRNRIKDFWLERAKTTKLPRIESQVNFETDEYIANLRVNTEIKVISDNLLLNKSDVIVDLGAGNGRFTMLFSPKAKKVTAVEYVSDFANYIKKQAQEMNYDNIEVLNIPAENFCRQDYADVIFVSGLLHYLDSQQYSQTIKNISKTHKSGGMLFLRETVSVLVNEYLVDKFSDELNAYYCSLYRTTKQHIKAFQEQGYHLQKVSPFFEDGSILNKRLETRLYYFIFTKN